MGLKINSLLYKSFTFIFFTTVTLIQILAISGVSVESSLQNHGWPTLQRSLEEIEREKVFAIQDQAEKLFKRLQEYISDVRFDIEWFSHQASKHMMELSEIKRIARTLSTVEKIETQLSFTSNMYFLMDDAAEYLKNSNKPSNPGQVMVNEIIELKVRIMALHNSSGSLDFSIAKYKIKILRLYRHLDVLKREFMALKEVSHFREMFRNRAVWADMALQKLWSQVRERSPDCSKLSHLQNCWIE